MGAVSDPEQAISERMSKSKLRSIVVNGEEFLWSFSPGYRRTEGDGFVCQDQFTAYKRDHRTSPLRVHFTTWECAISGGPLRIGAPIAPGDPAANLHTPAWAARLIEAALAAGWDPMGCRRPFTIEDGVPFLRERAPNHEQISPRVAPD